MNHTIKIIYNKLPNSIKELQNRIRFKDRLLLLGKSFREKKALRRIQKKVRNGEQINVVFFAMSVAFWKYDDVFKLMQTDKKYNPCILLCLRPQDPLEIQQMHRDKMLAYFQEKGFPCISKIDEIDPDFLFYAQPYKNSVPEELRAYNFLDKLICYVPYAFFISNYRWAYDAQVHNLAWKLFYPSTLHLQNAKEIAFNKGKNVEVVGYPLADKFLSPAANDPWKIKDRHFKRIIWGAHHSVLDDDICNPSTFLKNAKPMLELARKSKDCQFAFKPHPHLKEHLYKHPDWGKVKTDAYFDAWNIAENTFRIDGDYVDLFKTSDALIHDCGSFTVEYLYVNKPIIYIGNQREDILCHFGKRAMEGNYTLKDTSIENFIQNIVVANGMPPAINDIKEPIRRAILKNDLTPPNGKTFAQNIMDFLENACG